MQVSPIIEDIKRAEQASELRGQKIAILDIERVRGEAAIKFWSLGDYKNRRIHADDVTAWPRTICLAWKWYGEKKIEFAAEWEESGDMLDRAWGVYDEADIVVGHNLGNFDTKHLKSGWRDAGFPPPSPFKVVDTLDIARREFGDESKTLDALCHRLGLEGKVGRYNSEQAEAAIAGNKTAQRELRKYNKADVVATEQFYDALRGWMPGHPHTIAGTAPRCPQCGSTDLIDAGTTQAILLTYPLYRCAGCGGNVKGTRSMGRVATTRGAR